MIQPHSNDDGMQQNQNGELLDLIAEFAKEVLQGIRYEIGYYAFPYEDRLVIRLPHKQTEYEQPTQDPREQCAPEAN